MIPRLDDAVRDRSRVHRALGDAVRLALVEALLLSDMTPQQAGAALGVRSNLLAHHLNVLADVGLVARLRSAGDGRRRYLHLDASRVAGVVRPPRLQAREILFVCSRNAARSQLATALWSASAAVPAQSAGASPASAIAPGAIAAARAHGLGRLTGRPRGLADVTGRPDLLITLCDRANEFDDLPRTTLRLHWSIPDPLTSTQPAAFDRTVTALQGWIATLQQALQPAT